MKEFKRPSLGAVMIVKDEEERLGSILSDISDVVDEIVVIDTGSEDRTVDVAKSYGARVGSFPWCNDFSAARNKSIELAQSDYLLWLDADDRIDEENRRKVLELRGHLRPEKNKGYLLKVVSRDGEDSSLAAYQLRIFPNREGVEFEGRIHEQILPSLERCGIASEHIDITIEHSGYHCEGTIKEKAGRNLKIQMDELKRGKDDAAHLFAIAMSCYALGEHEKCLEYIRRVRAIQGSGDLYKYTFLTATECYTGMNDAKRALQELGQALEYFPDSGIFHYFTGIILLKIGRTEEAVAALGKAACLGIKVGNYPLPADIREKAHFTYGTALEKAGRAEEAIEAYQACLRVNPEYVPALMALGMALLSRGAVPEAAEALEKAREARNAFDRSLWLCLARAWYHLGRYDEAHNLYLRSIQEIPGDVEVLSGLVQTSIEKDDVEVLQSSLESFMVKLGMDTEREITSTADLAALCAEIALMLIDRDDFLMAGRLADSALRIDAACAGAYVALADCAAASGNRREALGHLEKALSNGTFPALIVERMEKFGAQE